MGSNSGPGFKTDIYGSPNCKRDVLPHLIAKTEKKAHICFCAILSDVCVSPVCVFCEPNCHIFHAFDVEVLEIQN